MSRQISSNAGDTAMQANSVSAASEEVSSNVQTVAAATEELSASIRGIARSTTDAARVANDAVSLAVSTNASVSGSGRAAAVGR